MRMRLVAVAITMAGAAAALTAQGLQTPADWRWLNDEPAKLVQGQDVPPGAWRFVAMPPGWHVTTGPGALLFHPEYAGKGNFSIEAEIFLFPGESPSEYGVFLGGRDLDPQKSPSYLAFVARRDGKAAVLRLGGMSPIVDWKANSAVMPHPGKDTAKNILRVDVNPADIIFSANGKDVIRLPRAGLGVDGQVGFRIGKGLDVHVSRLDITHRLAPVPVK